GVWFFVFSMLFIIFMVNAVNLTDGIDGLCSTVMFVACLGFIVISSILGYVGTTMLSTAIAAGCIGFIIWNFFPAKVFMGDTGSMFLGGAFMAMAYGVSFPMLAMLCGIVFVCEGMSVVIQMTYFRLSHGKRLFKMTPIHHHFELCGFTEIKIVVTFGLVALFGSILAVGAAFIR
ncbi:MAG: phospho-N-acetylmuramoyl-pentapeptide-transferase, partial [Oscillospiraceae bacterium]